MNRTLISLLVFSVLVLANCTHKNAQDQNTELRKIAATGTLDSSGYLYDPNDTSCDGYPRLMVETAPGTCLGMVMPRDRAKDSATDRDFIMPRSLLQIPGTQSFLVLDMGGWAPANGRLFLMYPSQGRQYAIKLLKYGLNMPHGLQMGPDGYIYLGESKQLNRFRLNNGTIADWNMVIDLSKIDGYMHPLTHFVFDPRTGDLYINSGSLTDHCYAKTDGKYNPCPEQYPEGLKAGNAMAAILRVPADMLKAFNEGKLASIKYTSAVATGLRNSMAMAIHPSGYLIQGENSRDFAQQEEPYEEINVIDIRPEATLFYHYGWPYCYNMHATSPEWDFPENKRDPIRGIFYHDMDCKVKAPNEHENYQAPWALMPPHVAPTGMGYYKGPMFDDMLRDKLLVAWHGYQPGGHRLVAYSTDAQGRPVVREPNGNETYKFDQAGGCPIDKPFKPQGGLDRVAPYNELISKWNAKKGIRPLGTPTTFTIADDGSIWIVEDKNRVVVRLAKSDSARYTEPCGGGSNNTGKPVVDPRAEMLAYRNFVRNSPEAMNAYAQVQKGLISKYCIKCHGGFTTDAINPKDRFTAFDWMVSNHWFTGKQPEKSKMYAALTTGGNVPPMPPYGEPQFKGTAEEAQILENLRRFINVLPAEIESHTKAISMGETRNVRNTPTIQGSKVCATYKEGDTVYIDPRPETQVQADNITWFKTYIVPKDSRLLYNACPYPEDGVFYMAAGKWN